MMFTKADRNLLNLIDAKLNSDQQFLFCLEKHAKVQADTWKRVEERQDKIMQSQVALSIMLDLINRELMTLDKSARPRAKSRKK